MRMRDNGLHSSCVIVLLAVAALAPSADAATFTVNGTADLVDANPGDGICASAGPASICSLRAVIEQANASPGDDTIVVPAGTYVLDAGH